MKFRTKFGVVGSLAASAALVAACASTQPPRELVDARAALERARSSPAAQLKPDSLIDAQNALQKAEHAYSAQVDDDRVRALAYMAERKAEQVQVEAQDVANSTDIQQAESQIQQITEQQLSQAQTRVSTSEQQRKDAEAREREIMERLTAANAGNVRQESRGTVVTMPGEVLFTVGKSTLLPSAQSKLDDVAKVLSEIEGRATIEGYTDSTGSDATNQRLSQQRAEAVRDYLVSKGVKRERIEARGFGEDRPMTSNATASGRAMNRRVEIVIHQRSGS
jgi:outer membrane protein OmpA-like peptidoglycan-associated protein